MMELILWRHADAEPGEGMSAEEDMDRALTAKGRKQARRMAAWLERSLPSRCKILVSPATRTVQTAQALGRPFKLCAALGPQASVQAVLESCGWPDSKLPVLVVGHQPTLGQVTSLLISGLQQDLAVRKGNIVWVARQQDSEIALLRAVVSPDLVRA